MVEKKRTGKKVSFRADQNSRENRGGANRWIFAVLTVLFAASGLFAATRLFAAFRDYASGEKEYREYQIPVDQSSEPNLLPAQADAQKIAELVAINSDYIGWISIEDTSVDYPVVQGTNNDYYLYYMFSGERNPTGTIFMDYRCGQQFEETFSVLYGHNRQDQSMFGGLNLYLDEEYLKQHERIAIVTSDGEERNYRVFAARDTDIYDEAYTLIGADAQAIHEYMQSQGAPKGGKYLLLSTCTDSADDDDRLLVIAVLQP